jgi:transcriptional regulator with XRE-family HTH domain
VTRKIPAEQCAVIGANLRVLRQRNGWTQARLGKLMGWDTSTVCAAEGHRSGRQRGFTTGEIIRLAAVLGIPPAQLTTRCATCGGHPPAGYACLACGAVSGTGRPAASAPAPQEHLCHAGAGR